MTVAVEKRAEAFEELLKSDAERSVEPEGRPIALDILERLSRAKDFWGRNIDSDDVYARKLDELIAAYKSATETPLRGQTIAGPPPPAALGPGGHEQRET